MILPSGGFFTLAGWLLLFNWREQRKTKKHKTAALSFHEEVA
jgi:hypothetical protein